MVGVRAPGPGTPDPAVTNLVRGVLFRETDSRVFETTDGTFVIAERQRDAAGVLDTLAGKLEAEMEALRSRSPALDGYQLTVGTTVKRDPACTAADLLMNARASRHYAEVHEREKFICFV
jgi:hypothetical protein